MKTDLLVKEAPTLSSLSLSHPRIDSFHSSLPTCSCLLKISVNVEVVTFQTAGRR